MHEIICPHCKKAFKIDEAGYADILKQVHDSEFEQLLHERLELAEKDKINAVELAKEKIGSEMQKATATKNIEIHDLKAKLDAGEVAQQLAVTEAMKVVEKERDVLVNELKQAEKDKINAVELAKEKVGSEMQKATAANDIEIQNLKAKLDAGEISQQLAVTEALKIVENERDVLSNELKQAKQYNETTSELAKANHSKQLQETSAKKDAEIQELKAKLNANEVEQKYAITEAISEVEKGRDQLKSDLERATLEKQLAETALKDKYETQVKDRDHEIERLRDMKARLSTKMVGETLEQHCETEFNRIRATAFPKAYFEKDNDVRTGSKGDYIFRDSDESDTEIVSIMFEMKNENNETATKKKNEDFLKELDKDRNEKQCEYAVLVSLLEPDSELYNSGIIDVSHRYQKMYIIRPQFFIPIITLLRNAAQNSLKYKTELAIVKAQNVDITNFEGELDEFRAGFSRNYELASW